MAHQTKTKKKTARTTAKKRNTVRSKTVRKKARPKTTTKKTTARKAQKPSRHHSHTATPEEAFWMNHGPIVFDLASLYTVLRDSTNDEQFLYHLSNGRNDYVVWVRVVLKDRPCATSLARSRTREDAVRVLEGCLKIHH